MNKNSSAYMYNKLNNNYGNLEVPSCIAATRFTINKKK